MSKDKQDKIERTKKPKDRFFRKHKEPVQAQPEETTEEKTTVNQDCDSSLIQDEPIVQADIKKDTQVSDESALITHFVDKPDVHGVEYSEEIAEVFRRFAATGTSEPVIADCAISADYLVCAPEGKQQSKVEVTIA